MRQDARSLLKKLNLNGFRYQDFSASSVDLELWPFFEALLRDDRIVGQAPAPAVVPLVKAEQRPAPAPAAAPRPKMFFEAYAQRVEAPAAPEIATNVRDFLGGLGGRGA